MKSRTPWLQFSFLLLCAGVFPVFVSVSAQVRNSDSIVPLLTQPSMNVYRRFAVDRTKMTQFYGEVLALRPLPTFNMPDGGQMTRFQVGTSEIKLLAAPAGRGPKSVGPRDAVGLHVLTFFFPDAAALSARFEARGYPSPQFRSASDENKVALVTDPDGQLVELVVIPGVSQSRETFDRIEVGLTVSDIEKSRTFYGGFVGLEELTPVDEHSLGTKKYRYRHGTTTVNFWTFGKGRAANADNAGIQYVLRNIEAVDARAKAQGVKVVRPLGNFTEGLRTLWLSDPDGIVNYFAETARSRQTTDPSAR